MFRYIWIVFLDGTSGGAEVVGALMMTLLLGPPVVNECQDPDTKTPTNVVGYFMIFVGFSFQIMGIISDFKVGV